LAEYGGKLTFFAQNGSDLNNYKKQKTFAEVCLTERTGKLPEQIYHFFWQRGLFGGKMGGSLTEWQLCAFGPIFAATNSGFYCYFWAGSTKPHPSFYFIFA